MDSLPEIIFKNLKKMCFTLMFSFFVCSLSFTMKEDNSESSAVEQPSTSNSAPHTMQAASSASGHETDSSPPYSSITVEVPTTSGIVALSRNC